MQLNGKTVCFHCALLYSPTNSFLLSLDHVLCISLLAPWLDPLLMLACSHGEWSYSAHFMLAFRWAGCLQIPEKKLSFQSPAVGSVNRINSSIPSQSSLQFFSPHANLSQIIADPEITVGRQRISDQNNHLSDEVQNRWDALSGRKTCIHQCEQNHRFRTHHLPLSIMGVSRNAQQPKPFLLPPLHHHFEDFCRVAIMLTLHMRLFTKQVNFW